MEVGLTSLHHCKQIGTTLEHMCPSLGTSTPHKHSAHSHELLTHEIRPISTTPIPMTDTDESGEYVYTGRPKWIADLKVRFGRWLEQRRNDD